MPLRGQIPHQSAQGVPLKPKSNHEYPNITRFGLAILFTGAKGNSPLQTIKYQPFLIWPMLSILWGVKSIIFHSRGSPKSLKAIIDIPKIASFGIAIFFTGEEVTATLKSSNIYPFWFSLPHHLAGRGASLTSPIFHQFLCIMMLVGENTCYDKW